MGAEVWRPVSLELRTAITASGMHLHGVVTRSGHKEHAVLGFPEVARSALCGRWLVFGWLSFEWKAEPLNSVRHCRVCWQAVERLRALLSTASGEVGLGMETEPTKGIRELLQDVTNAVAESARAAAEADAEAKRAKQAAEAAEAAADLKVQHLAAALVKALPQPVAKALASELIDLLDMRDDF